MNAAVVLEITLFTIQLAFSRGEGSWLNERHRIQQLQKKVSKLRTALRKMNQETQSFASLRRRESNRHFISIPASCRRTITQERYSTTHIFHGKSLIE